MQSVLWENDSQSCLKLGLTQNIAIQIAVKKVNIIFIASEFQVFLQTNFVIFEVKIRFDYNIFLTYDNLKVLFKSDVNYLFWLLWNTKWKMEMIGMTQNLILYCFVPKKMNLQRMTSCDFHSYYNMLYNTAYFVLNNWYHVSIYKTYFHVKPVT